MPVAAILSISEDELEYQWFTDDGRQRHTTSVRWADVRSVDVFKRDLFTYDLVCMLLTARDDTVVEFDEEDPCWMRLMSVLPLRLPGCKCWHDWFSEVAFPAFEEKLQRVFDRESVRFSA